METDPYRGYKEQEADRSIIVVGMGGAVAGLDRVTGATRWYNELPGDGVNEVFLAMRHGCLIVSADNDKLYRLDYLTGRTLWWQVTSTWGRASIVIEPDVIVVGKGGWVDAFDHAGVRLWQRELHGKDRSRISLGVWGNLSQADDAGRE